MLDRYLRASSPPVGQRALANLTRVLRGRAERIAIDPAECTPSHSGSHIEGVVVDVTYLGSTIQFHVHTDSFGRVVSQRIDEGEQAHLRTGSRVVLSWPLEAAFVLSADNRSLDGPEDTGPEVHGG
jgi:ABC-type Fe3+/spermidine/putrescine transport system ATPase subunit